MAKILLDSNPSAGALSSNLATLSSSSFSRRSGSQYTPVWSASAGDTSMARPPPLLLVVVAMPPVWTAVLQTALPQHTPAQLILREPSTVHAVALVQASGASDCNDPAALRILTTSSVDSCAEVQCTTEWDLGTASTGHYLLCVSRDEGASWVFADGYGADPGRLVAVQGVVSSFDQMYSLVPKRGESSSDVRRQEPPVDLTHVSGSFAAGTELSISRALDCAVAAGTAAVAVAPLATPQNGCPDESCASSFLLNDNSRGLAVSASKTGVPYWVCYRPSGSSVRVNTGIRLWVQDALTSFPSQLDLKVSLHTLDLGQSSLRTVVLGFPPPLTWWRTARVWPAWAFSPTPPASLT